jgi:hypothetical protein
MVTEGKVRHIGLSGAGPGMIRRAQALLAIADQDEPPLRCVAGADAVAAVEAVEAKVKELLGQANASRELGGDLAYDDTAA